MCYLPCHVLILLKNKQMQSKFMACYHSQWHHGLLWYKGVISLSQELPSNDKMVSWPPYLYNWDHCLWKCFLYSKFMQYHISLSPLFVIQMHIICIPVPFRLVPIVICAILYSSLGPRDPPIVSRIWQRNHRLMEYKTDIVTILYYQTCYIKNIVLKISYMSYIM